MNKGQLLEKVSQENNISKKLASKVVTNVFDLIVEALKRWEAVSLFGFGRFTPSKRKARIGVDPRNPSKKIKIPPRVVTTFRAWSVIKKALNK